jgi:hypothetical protein
MKQIFLKMIRKNARLVAWIILWFGSDQYFLRPCLSFLPSDGTDDVNLQRAFAVVGAAS